jgi:heme exporter protein C
MNLTAEQRTRILQVTIIISFLGVLFGAYLALFWVGEDAAQGPVQRIFYMHVPAFVGAFVAFVTGAISGAIYLRTRDKKWDTLAISSIEVGFVLAFINLTSGITWAHPIWGTWWEWDPRLTSAAIMTLTYAAYLMLRNGIESDDQRYRFASIYGILALSTVIFTTIITRVRQDTIHPVITGMEDQMTTVLMTNMFIWALILTPTLIWVRLRLESKYEQVQRIRVRNMEH